MTLEERIINSAKQGDSRALSTTYNTIKPFVKMTMMRKFTGQIKHDELDYHVHCVVSKVLLKIDYYSNERGAFSTWVAKLTNNYVYDLFRNKVYKQDQQNISIDMNQTDDDDSSLINILPSDDEIEKQMHRAAGIEFVDMLIDKCSKNEEQKKIIILRHKDDLKYDEIEKATGTPVGSIKSILYRFRNSCLEAIKELKDEYDYE
jgi:RNA polymerase sigma-70 factor (ECF subfamily)